VISLEYIFEGLFKAWEVMWASEGSGLFFAGAFFCAIVLFILGMIQNRVVRYPVYAGTAVSDVPALPEPEAETPLLSGGVETDWSEDISFETGLGHRDLVVTEEGELAPMAPNPAPVGASTVAPNTASTVAPNEEPLPPKIPERTPPIGEPVLAPNTEPIEAPSVAPKEEPKPEPGLVGGAKRLFNKLVPPPQGAKDKTPGGMRSVPPGKGELGDKKPKANDDEPVFEYARDY